MLERSQSELQVCVYNSYRTQTECWAAEHQYFMVLAAVVAVVKSSRDDMLICRVTVFESSRLGSSLRQLSQATSPEGTVSIYISPSQGTSSMTQEGMQRFILSISILDNSEKIPQV